MAKTMENTLQKQTTESRIAELEYLPAPSPIVAKLLASITEKHTTFEDISSIIESDAAVTSQLLKIANSAYYGFRRTVEDLERAVMLIGITEVRNICLAICLVNQFNPRLLPKGFTLYSFWTHNLMTSFCCKELARDQQWVHDDEIYLMGLLHDLGRLAIAATMPEKFNMIALLSRKKEIPISRAEEASGLPHTEVGGWLAIKWGFSEKIKAVLKYHHAPLSSARYSRECALVQTAASISKEIDPEMEQQKGDLPDPRILALAGISLEELASLTEKAASLQEEVCQIASVLVGNNRR